MLNLREQPTIVRRSREGNAARSPRKFVGFSMEIPSNAKVVILEYDIKTARDCFDITLEIPETPTREGGSAEMGTRRQNQVRRFGRRGSSMHTAASLIEWRSK